MAKTFGDWTPYVFYSNFEGEFRFIAPGGISAGFEDGATGTLDDDYNSIGVGLRYNINPRTALKFEITDFNDDGDAAVFIDEDQDGDTDATAVAISLDLVF
ncbi:hypothetical protein [Alteromonas gracilis]|uniref:hypothetical protein n=1 Tax=Alteromonas gracilis TaxID=1479524 RepID=UPI00321B90D5